MILNWDKVTKAFQFGISVIKEGLNFWDEKLFGIVTKLKKVLALAAKATGIGFGLDLGKAAIGKVKGFFNREEVRPEGISSVAAPNNVNVENNINQTIDITGAQGTTASVRSRGDNVNLGVNMRES